MYSSYGTASSDLSANHATYMPQDPNGYYADDQYDDRDDTEQGDAKRRRIARVSKIGRENGGIELTRIAGLRHVSKEEDQM